MLWYGVCTAVLSLSSCACYIMMPTNALAEGSPVEYFLLAMSVTYGLSCGCDTKMGCEDPWWLIASTYPHYTKRFWHIRKVYNPPWWVTSHPWRSLCACWRSIRKWCCMGPGTVNKVKKDIMLSISSPYHPLSGVQDNSLMLISPPCAIHKENLLCYFGLSRSRPRARRGRGQMRPRSGRSAVSSNFSGGDVYDIPDDLSVPFLSKVDNVSHLRCRLQYAPSHAASLDR